MTTAATATATREQASETGGRTLEIFANTPRLNEWLFSKLASGVRGDVLEGGSGLGNISRLLRAKATHLVVTDTEPHYLRGLRETFAGRGPLMMTYRVNAGPLPPTHWLNDPAVGGGRIIGEACHFIDFMSFLTGDSPIVSVEARTTDRFLPTAQNVAATIGFKCGSVGLLLYASGGSSRLGKESIEVHGGGASATIEDFRICRLYRGRTMSHLPGSGKGHVEALTALLRAAREKGAAPVATATIAGVTRATFAIQAALGIGLEPHVS